jgi:arylsulfatase A-like enzyme
MPTILDLAGVPVPQAVQGRSLRPLIERKTRAHRPWALSSWTLVQDEQVRPPSTLTTREWAFIHGGDEAEHALYSLPSDPGQQKNLFKRERAMAQRMHLQYLRILKALGVSEERIALRADLDAPRRRARGIRRFL